MGNSRLTPAQAERRAQVVRMRSARLSFAEIGRRLGITAQRAGVIYRRALQEIPRADVDEHRAEELEFIDLAVNRLITIAMDKEVSARTRVEAWNAIRGWTERKAKLLGLDAPTKHEVLTMDGIEAEIRRLEREIAVNIPAAEVAT
jgi:ribosomal protein L15E